MSDNIDGHSWNATWNEAINVKNDPFLGAMGLNQPFQERQPGTSGYDYNQLLPQPDLQGDSIFVNNEVVNDLQTMENFDLQYLRSEASCQVDSSMKDNGNEYQSLPQSGTNMASCRSVPSTIAIKTEATEVNNSIVDAGSFNQHQHGHSQGVQINASKIQASDEVLNLLLQHKLALLNGQSHFDLQQLSHAIKKWSISHKCLDLIREGNDEELSLEERESFQVLFIDGIAITKKMWAKASNQRDLIRIANSLFEDIFTPYELLHGTMKSRLKQGVKSKALDPIRIGVINKIAPYIKNNRGRGNSFELFQPNDPNNPYLTADEMTMVRDALGQKRNNCNQGQRAKRLKISKLEK